MQGPLPNGFGDVIINREKCETGRTPGESRESWESPRKIGRLTSKYVGFPVRFGGKKFLFLC